MIESFPSKHIRLNESFLGLGAIVLIEVSTPISVDDLWRKIQQGLVRNKYHLPRHLSIDDLVKALVLLKSKGLIELSTNGDIVKCT